MENSFEGGKIIPHVVREKVDLPVAREAGCHNPRGRKDSDSCWIAGDLDLNYRTKPQRLQYFVRDLLGSIKRKIAHWLI